MKKGAKLAAGVALATGLVLGGATMAQANPIGDPNVASVWTLQSDSLDGAFHYTDIWGNSAWVGAYVGDVFGGSVNDLVAESTRRELLDIPNQL